MRYAWPVALDVDPLHSFRIQSKDFISNNEYLFAGAIEYEFGNIRWAVPQYHPKCSYKSGIPLDKTECKQSIHVEFFIADEIEN